MLHEVIPTLPSTESTFEEGPRSVWAQYQEASPRQPQADSKQLLDRLPEQSQFFSHRSRDEMSGLDEDNENETRGRGPSLFQELFFFCTIMKIGDLPGSGCIYVETVVDRDSGLAFAKVYSAKQATNAVDILASRVVPFFKRRGVAIKEIHTRKTSEYCGLIPAHPFEAFLSTSHIRHLPTDQPGQPCNSLCEEFYRHLLKNFFLPALRKISQFSLAELQKDLDTFVAAYNARQTKHENDPNDATQPPTNFPVHP